jgi:hypothetical protein
MGIMCYNVLICGLWLVLASKDARLAVVRTITMQTVQEMIGIIVLLKQDLWDPLLIMT